MREAEFGHRLHASYLREKLQSPKIEMNSDFTQQQSLGGLERAEQLSLQSTMPPAEVTGYRVEKLLGQGAFGQVWLAQDLNTGRHVAIKFYLHRRGVNWTLINREVKNLVNMSTGRYIVQVLKVGWDAEPPYYVMEYLENGSLEDMIRAQGSLGVSLTAKILREVAEGLSYAHGKGVLHCDLKPANVMLDHDWRPRLADFGQSRMTDDQTPSLGTLFFMAPEQADLSASPDAAWDVYALGAIAYSMLVGSPPYRTPEVVETLDTADSLTDRLHRYRDTIRKAPRPRLHYRRREIDKGLCQIIDRCLAPQSEDRYANVQQVIGALDARSRARTRRPLYLMGIVGPLLFLILVLFFSARSIGVAKQESIQSVQEWSLRSNRFAAQLAAKSLESEIGNLFDLVEDEAQRIELRTLLQQVTTEGESLLDVLADGKSHPEQCDQLGRMPEQLEFSHYLDLRLQSILSHREASNAIFNSMFVNDARGTNVGIEFAEPEEQVSQNTLGYNFAYRSYFNGQRQDGSYDSPTKSFKPIRFTHLSAAFRSTSTGKWKVGISTPIWPLEAGVGTNNASDERQPLGVLVMTINLGDFELLSGNNQNELERFASLVDGRAGNGQGTLLQHPFLRELERSGQNRNTSIPQVDPRFLQQLTNSEGIVNYQDPFARVESAEPYGGLWIAAMQQVRLPRRSRVESGKPSTSDLWVLVQEQSKSVARPVEQLGSRLQRETYIEFGAMLAVMSVLWFFVLRYRQLATRGVTKDTKDYLSSYPSTIDHSH